MFVVEDLTPLAAEAFDFPLKAGLVGPGKDFPAGSVGAGFGIHGNLHVMS